MKTSFKASQFWSATALATVLFAASPSHAQVRPLATEGSGHSGGGQITESDFRSYMGKMDAYFQTEEGKAAFPEIVEYDRNHLETESFHHLIEQVKPTVKALDLIDSYGEARDCMSYANSSGRYFVCDSRKLPEKTLENQPSFYRIALHELFVQAGIEKPISKAIPSDYSVSFRITQNVHLETYQEWLPGKAARSNEMDMGQVCADYHGNAICGHAVVFTHQGMGGPEFKKNLVIDNIATSAFAKEIKPRDTVGDEMCASFLVALQLDYDRVKGKSNELRFASTDIGAEPHQYYFTRKTKVFGHGLFVNEVWTLDHTCGTESHLSRLPRWRIEGLSCGYDHSIEPRPIN